MLSVVKAIASRCICERGRGVCQRRLITSGVSSLTNRLNISQSTARQAERKSRSCLSESFDFPCVFFLLGVGILHSMEKATQFVHGTPKLAASHRTWVC